MRNKLWRNFGAKLLDPYTIKVMIMSRYRYRPVTVPLPSRYRFRAIVTLRDIIVTDLTDRYRILPLQALQTLPIMI
jgi:hypothetical protein